MVTDYAFIELTPEDITAFFKLPVGEVTELPGEDGWKQWDLAVNLMT